MWREAAEFNHSCGSLNFRATHVDDAGRLINRLASHEETGQDVIKRMSWSISMNIDRPRAVLLSTPTLPRRWFMHWTVKSTFARCRQLTFARPPNNVTAQCKQLDVLLISSVETVFRSLKYRRRIWNAGQPSYDSRWCTIGYANINVVCKIWTSVIPAGAVCVADTNPSFLQSTLSTNAK